MPRPKTDRAARALRLPRELDDLLVAEASRRGLSVSAAIEQAVVGWCAGLVPPVPQRRRSDIRIETNEVSPRFRDVKAGRS